MHRRRFDPETPRCALPGLTRLGHDGQVLDERRHPALIGYKESLTAFLNLAQRFGLSPYDRRRIDIPVDENTDDATRKFLRL